MATWIKAGFWEKLCKPCKGYKGWLNLDEFVKQNSGGPSYKVYTALLSQDGISDPIPTVLENTLGGTPVWTRDSVGFYYCTLPGAFTTNKTFCSFNNGYDWGNFGIGFFGTTVGEDNLVLYYRDSAAAPVDFQTGGVSDIFVEIRVYP